MSLTIEITIITAKIRVPIMAKEPSTHINHEPKSQADEASVSLILKVSRVFQAVLTLSSEIAPEKVKFRE